ncbi:MAG: response regulator [Chitinispirillaceae bacterium]|nr:response regulator [Chitinispirillaceae bacterium]
MLTVFSFFCMTVGSHGKDRPYAFDGMLDLAQFSIEKKWTFDLDGEWDFYWKKLLKPHDFLDERKPTKTGCFRVPGFWNGVVSGDSVLGGNGYATFRLRIMLPSNHDTVSLRIIEQNTAYRLWINGREVLSNGLAGTNRNASRPQALCRTASIEPDTNVLDAVLQISNFHRARGGPGFRITMSSGPLTTTQRMMMHLLDLVLIAILMASAFYHFGLHAMRPGERSFLCFACVCLLWGIRFFIEGTNGRLVTLLWHDVPYDLMTKAEYLPFALGVPATFLFLCSLYPDTRMRWIKRISAGLGTLFALMIVCAPVRFSGRFLPAYEAIACCTFIPGTMVVVRGLLRKQEGAWMVLGGFVLFMIAATNDILYDRRIIHTMNLVDVGLLSMIVSQAFVLMRRYSNAFISAELLSAQLQEKNVSLTRLDILKDEFLANTSHELRTPLNGMVGLAESILERERAALPDKAAAELGMIVDSGRRLSDLVSEIQDFSKLRHHDVVLDVAGVDLHGLTDTVLAMSAPLAEKKSISLVNSITPEMPQIRGDENRLQQVLYNLVGNAIKFTDRGAVTVEAALRDGMAVVSVSDTGIGIPADKFEGIFEPFEQAVQGSAWRGSGTGLGLAISKHLVELHGGAISVESTPGRGSIFTFTVPIDKGASAEGSRMPGASDPLPIPSAKQRPDVVAPALESVSVVRQPVDALQSAQVLVVDDDPVSLQVMTNHLTASGFTVCSATGGVEALERITNGFRPEIVLLDVVMPEISGYDVCRRLRRQYSPNELPVIMVTARDSLPDQLAGFSAGANDYIRKPVVKEELLARVGLHIKLEKGYRAIEDNRRLQEELYRREQVLVHLQTAHHRLKGILDTVDEPVFAVNENWDITFCNAAFQTLVGSSEESLLGHSHTVVVDSPDCGPATMPPPSEQQLACAATVRISGVNLRKSDGTIICRDLVIIPADLEEERLCVAVVYHPAPVEPEPDRPLPASVVLSIVEQLNRNRARIRALDDTLAVTTGNKPDVASEFSEQIRSIDKALESVYQILDEQRDHADLRGLAVEVMNRAVEYWIEAGGKDKFELARRSRLWQVYTNLDGWQRTQTLDKYLRVDSLPHRPRWSQIVDTAEFVLRTCTTPSQLRDMLERAAARLKEVLKA